MIGKVNKNVLKNRGIRLCPLIFLVLFFSCKKIEPKSVFKTNRVVIAYMIADNNLDPFSIDDLNEMEEGWSNFDGKLIVYLDRAKGANPSHPIVYEIEHDTTEKIISKVIKVYKEQNSADKDVLNKVLKEIINLYEAKEYGLILWSHGTGWLPSRTKIGSTQKSYLPILKSFGRDNDDEIDIKDLNTALDLGLNFEFILFDACYMGSIEVLYELKNRAKYFVCSPTEILSFGFPYKETIPILFQKKIDYILIGKSFYDFYNKQEGIYNSATISVVNSNSLEEVRQSFSELMINNKNLKIDKISNIQQYEISQSNVFFDLGNFMDSLALKNNYNLNKVVFDRLIIYKNNTNKILEELTLKSCSGLSVFIPDSLNFKFHNSYKKLNWYNESNYDSFFNTFGY